jgi:hypothetical protein
VGEEGGNGLLAVIRHGPGEQAEGDTREGVLVGPPVQRPARDLLGRAEVRGAEEHPGHGQPGRAGGGLGEPEVRQVGVLGAAGPGLDEDVARLDVPVHQADLVRGVQRGGDLHDEVGRPAWLQRPAVAAQQRREISVGYEPGRDVEHPVGFPGRVDGDDVRLVDCGDGP